MAKSGTKQLQADEIRELLSSGSEQLGIVLADEAVEQLLLYFSELKRWSRKMNLISRGAGDREIVEKHFLDSLTLLPLLKGGNVHLLDVGSGAGFPGLVCKAVQPNMLLTLVEPRLKRVSFLRHIVRTLELAQVEVIADRIEDIEMLAQVTPVSHITSRAVTDMSSFFSLIAQFARPGVQVICMKGPRWQEELQQLQATDAAGAFVHKDTIEQRLPFSGGERVLLSFVGTD